MTHRSAALARLLVRAAAGLATLGLAATGAALVTSGVAEVGRWPSSDAVVQPAQAPGRVSATGQVLGRVTAAETGEPLRLAQVRLVSSPDETPRFTADALTDAQGRYQFVGVPRGRYTLTVAKAGFVTLQFGQSRPGDPAKLLALGEGEVRDRVDVALPRGGAIEGRVLDEHGEPFVEATVTAWRLEFASETAGPRLVAAPRSAATNDRGQYRLYGLLPGTYYVSAIAAQQSARMSGAQPETPERPAAAYAPVYYPGAPSLAEAQRVVVRAGEDTPAIDILLRPVKLARVSGRVVSSRGTIATGAFVTLAPARSLGLPAAPGRRPSPVPVGSDGTFAIEGVPPGEYVLQVVAVPAAALEALARPGGTIGAVSSTPGSEFASLPVTVSGTDLTDLTVPLGPGGRVRGTVMVKEEPETGVGRQRGVFVTIHPASPETLAPSPTRAAVDADGAFDAGPVVGPVVLRVSQMPAALALDRVEYAGRDVTDTGVVVAPGEEVAGVRVVLTSQPLRLLGRVRAGEGLAVSACRVVVFADEPSRWQLPATRYVASVTPQASGAFEVIGLPPGSYRAVAVVGLEPGEWRDAEVLKGLWARGVPVRVEAGPTRPVDLACASR